MQILLFKWNKPLTQILLSQKSHKKNKKKFKKTKKNLKKFLLLS
jgi:hypothetical protein